MVIVTVVLSLWLQRTLIVNTPGAQVTKENECIAIAAASPARRRGPLQIGERVLLLFKTEVGRPPQDTMHEALITGEIDADFFVAVDSSLQSPHGNQAADIDVPPKVSANGTPLVWIVSQPSGGYRLGSEVDINKFKAEGWIGSQWVQGL